MPRDYLNGVQRVTRNPTPPPASGERLRPPRQPFQMTRDLPAFPVEVLPESIRGYVEQLAQELEVPVALPACLALGALASVCAGRITAHIRENWFEPTNLYLGVAMESGEGKSPVHKRIFAPIIELQKKRIDDWAIECQNLEEHNGQEGRKKKKVAAPPTMPCLFLNDATAEALTYTLSETSALLITSTEAGTFQKMCGQYAKNDQVNYEIYNCAYDGEPYRRKRIGSPDVYIHRPLLTIALAVQPSTVRALRKRSELRDVGLWPRFCFVFPPLRVTGQTFPAGLRNSEAEQAWRGLIERLGEGPLPPRPALLRFSEQGAETLLAMAREMSVEVLAGEALESIRDWCGKHRGRVARIAALLHVAEHGAEGQVSQETMERALRIGDFFLAHARHAFDVEMTASEEDRQAQRAWEVIERKGWSRVTPALLSQYGKGPFAQTKVGLAALFALTERGYLTHEKGKNGKGDAFRVVADPAAVPDDVEA